MRCVRAEVKLGRIISLKDTFNCQTVLQRLEQLHPIAQDLNRHLVLESPLHANWRRGCFTQKHSAAISAAKTAYRTKQLNNYGCRTYSDLSLYTIF
ncbi:hypothetical protein GJ496_006831 [Pomphorhynchus laevis]|nr:hypothetical protein GJ496_006831 [Pomphorhynchus laevis]